MTNNIRVTLLAMATGITYGAGTLILLFYNGVILGLVAADYIAGGQGVFLAGWLLPHGSIEIPTILLGGQASFIRWPATAICGWGTTHRARDVSARRIVGSVRDGNRCGGHAGMGRDYGGVHFAISSAGDSVCVEESPLGVGELLVLVQIPGMGRP